MYRQGQNRSYRYVLNQARQKLEIRIKSYKLELDLELEIRNRYKYDNSKVNSYRCIDELDDNFLKQTECC